MKNGYRVMESDLHVIELGDDRVVMSVDYPHADGPYPRGVETFLELPGVGAESKRKILWDNCFALYGFGEMISPTGSTS